MNKKISFPIAIIVIVLLAVLVGGVVIWQYLATSEEEDISEGVSENETANWKTYRNEEYGFEMKYPPEWIIIKEGIETKVNLKYYVLLADEKETEIQKEKQAGEIRCAVGVYLYNNDKGLPLYDWAIEKWGSPEEIELGKISEVNINDLEGIKYEFMSMGIQTNVLFSKDNKVIDIQTTLDDCDNLDEIFDQILSTFKFID